MSEPWNTWRHTKRECPRCHGFGVLTEIDGAFLRERRERAGLSLRELARRLGFTASYLCDLELNRRRATVELTSRYLKALS